MASDDWKMPLDSVGNTVGIAVPWRQSGTPGSTIIPQPGQPPIKSIEYFDNGLIKRIEYWEPGK